MVLIRPYRSVLPPFNRGALLVLRLVRDGKAAEALARVTGAIGVEDILGEVFSTFCIGK